MYYSKDLTEEKRLDLYMKLQHKVNDEAKTLQKSVSSRSGDEPKKELYSDQFKGEWFSLMCLWIENKATNEFVNESLEVNHVVLK